MQTLAERKPSGPRNAVAPRYTPAENKVAALVTTRMSLHQAMGTDKRWINSQQEANRFADKLANHLADHRGESLKDTIRTFLENEAKLQDISEVERDRMIDDLGLSHGYDSMPAKVTMAEAAEYQSVQCIRELDEFHPAFSPTPQFAEQQAYEEEEQRKKLEEEEKEREAKRKALAEEEEEKENKKEERTYSFSDKTDPASRSRRRKGEEKEEQDWVERLCKFWKSLFAERGAYDEEKARERQESLANLEAFLKSLPPAQQAKAQQAMPKQSDVQQKMQPENQQSQQQGQQPTQAQRSGAPWPPRPTPMGDQKLGG